MKLVIERTEGGSLWDRPQTKAEARQMARYTEYVGDEPGRCGDCAFREGTPANRSQLVLHCVESCLLSGGTFCCHHGDDPTRPCVGYQKLSQTFAARVPQEGQR